MRPSGTTPIRFFRSLGFSVRHALRLAALELLPELEHLRCQREQFLLDADSPLDSIFFVDSGVVSVMAVYSDGGTIEMAPIGREGCTGVQSVFGVKDSSARFFVQIPGSAAKMSRAAFNRVMGSVPSFRNLMYAY